MNALITKILSGHFVKIFLFVLHFVKGANFYNRLDGDNFSEKELHAIAEVLNCDYGGLFT